MQRTLKPYHQYRSKWHMVETPKNVYNRKEEKEMLKNETIEYIPRDAKRIPKMLKEIERIWKENPDIRLGQMLLNCFEFGFERELFEMEDEDLVKMLKEVYK